MADTTARTEAGTRDPWREAHETARALHDALLALGIPETVLGTLSARQTASGTHRIVVPPLPIADAERLLVSLGPALGPHGPRPAHPVMPPPRPQRIKGPGAASPHETPPPAGEGRGPAAGR
jgi:hypothetical protein